MATTACVIGAGPGGYVCAIRLARLGVKTTLVEREATMGGVCLNRGCIPSKAYISATRLWHEMKTAEEVGITFGDARVDLGRMKSWKDAIVSRLTGGIATLLEKNGVETVRGQAVFTAGNTLRVVADDGSTREVSADHFVIATGSSSIEIPGFEVDQRHILTSTGMLDLEEIPEHLVIIGGGVIGLEIGQYLMKLGTRLTIVEMMDQLLPGLDPDCVKVVARKLKKAKAAIHLKSRARGATLAGDHVEVVIETPKEETTVTADKVLVSVGRRPNTQGLGLELAGVEVDARGFVKTDSQQRTSNGRIFAIGDVTGPPLLAHRASKQGLVAAGVIAGGSDVMDAVMPAAVFTDPEIGSVGLTEAQAREAGHDVRTGSFPFAASGRALAARETEGMVKIVADAVDDRILGVHIVGPHASELIAEATLAIEAGLVAEDLALTVHTHPTLSEALMEAAEDVHRMAVHIYNPPGR